MQILNRTVVEGMRGLYSEIDSVARQCRFVMKVSTNIMEPQEE